MKKHIISTLLIVIASYGTLSAQTNSTEKLSSGNQSASAACPAIIFTYDNFGNRIKRHKADVACFVQNENGKQATPIPNPISQSNTENEKGFAYKNAWKIYPNPTNGVIQIEQTNTDPNAIQIQVMNNEGKIILQQEMQSTQTAVDLSPFADGVFFIHIQSTTEKSNFKIIKTSK